MADDIQDFFEDQVQWVGKGDEPVMDPSRPPRPPRSRKEMRKNRRKRQRTKIIRAVLIIAILALIGICGWLVFSKMQGVKDAVQVSREQVQDYTGPGTGEIDFTVENGEDSVQIGDKLTKAGIVKSSLAFQQAVSSVGKSDLLQPGTFSLKYRMAAEDVVEILTDSTKAGGFLVVNPGERSSTVIDQAAKLSGIDKSEFDALVKAKGTGILPSEAKGSFEGWLEPGTYNVKSMKSAKEIMKTMVDKRIEKLDTLGAPKGADRQRVITIASIVEGEVNKAEYYGKVSRVVENRLKKNMPLGMDSVVAYGNNVAPRALTNAMLNDKKNPYNSRIQKGLPPTPISQPGDAAIQAAMKPEQGEWLYFVTVNLDTGETKFTASESEFHKYAAEYQKWEKEN